ncbi:MAG: amidohydrolase [Candidatus Zixiibacteriota bacterium]
MPKQKTAFRFINGSIVTMDPDNPVAGEVITQGHSIAWVGRRGDAPTEYRKARTIDLKGRLLLPAFTDAHVHVLYWAETMREVNLRGAMTLTEALARIRKHAAAHPGKGWLTGGELDINPWGGKWPSARDLDRAVADRPAAIMTHDAHTLWANSTAMKKCGINSTTPDPPGGRIIRDDSGEPTGIFFESPAYRMLIDHVPAPTLRQAQSMVLDAQAHAHAKGVAALADMGMHDNLTIDAFLALQEKGKLALRLWKSIAKDDLDKAIKSGLRSGMGNRWIKIGSVKIFLDGALGSQTAWMKKPYSSNKKSTGVRRLTHKEFDDLLKRASAGHVSACVHAIGDAAVREALRGLGKYRSKFPKSQPPRIEHAQLVDPADIPLFVRHGIIASMQPSHLLTDRDYADKHWGRRARWAFACRSLWNAGVPLAFGSDVPIEPLDPIAGIGAAVYRARPEDRRGTWHPAEALNVWQAVWAFTAGAAMAAGDQGLRGQIKQGQLADLVILDRNIFTIPAKEIFRTQVTHLFVDGHPTYRAARDTP